MKNPETSGSNAKSCQVSYRQIEKDGSCLMVFWRETNDAY